MKVYTREVAKDIINIFEDLLDEYDINIPDDDRQGDDGEARIYGMAFDKLLDEVECMVIELLYTTGVKYKESEWHNGDWYQIQRRN